MFLQLLKINHSPFTGLEPFQNIWYGFQNWVLMNDYLFPYAAFGVPLGYWCWHKVYLTLTLIVKSSFQEN